MHAIFLEKKIRIFEPWLICTPAQQNLVAWFKSRILVSEASLRSNAGAWDDQDELLKYPSPI